MMTYLCKTNALKKYKLPSLKLVLTGGSQINPKIFKEFKNNLPQTVVLQAYGELTVLCLEALRELKVILKTNITTHLV